MMRNSIFGNADPATVRINDALSGLIIDEELYRSKAIKAGKEIVKKCLTQVLLKTDDEKNIAQQLFNRVMEKGLPTLCGCYNDVTDKSVSATHFEFPADAFATKFNEKFCGSLTVADAFEQTVSEFMPQHITTLAQNNFLRYFRHLIIKLQDTFSSSRDIGEKNNALVLKHQITHHVNYRTLIETFIPPILAKFTPFEENNYQRLAQPTVTIDQKKLLTKIFATIAILYGQMNTVRTQADESYPWENHWNNIKANIVNENKYNSLPVNVDLITIFLKKSNTYQTVLAESRSRLSLTGSTEADKLIAIIEKLHNKQNQLIGNAVAQNHVVPYAY